MAISRYLRDEMDTTFIEQALERSLVDETYGEIVDQLLEEEYKHFNSNGSEGRESNNEDECLATLIRRRVKHLNNNTTQADRTTALAALMWRLRQQSVVFEVYTALYDEGLVNLSALQHDVDFHARDKTVREVYRALNRSFEFGTKLHFPPRIGLCDSYAIPQIWLACMIVRGAIAPFQTIAHFIAASRTMGAFDDAIFRKCWPDGKGLQVSPMAQAISLAIPSSQRRRKSGFGVLGFHLPVGIGFPCKLEDIYYAFDEPLRVCEEVFVRYFRVSEEVFVPAGRIWMP